MRAFVLAGLLVPLGPWLVGCGRDAATHAAGLAERASGAADPLEQGPRATSYRTELRRAAMRGISYEGGLATIVPEEALTLVAARDATAAAAAAREAREQLARNEVIDALASQTRAVLLAPEDPAQYLSLGDVLMANRHGAEALAAYRRGLAFEPDSGALHAAAGRALVAIGERTDAVAELRAALRIDPKDADALQLLALQLFYLDDPSGAWEAAHAAEQLGRELPPQFRALLAQRMPEPMR